MYIYRFDFQSGNFQSWKLTQTSSGDCDLYVRYNAAPTLNQWDYANVSVSQESSVRLELKMSFMFFFFYFYFLFLTFYN